MFCARGVAGLNDVEGGKLGQQPRQQSAAVQVDKTLARRGGHHYLVKLLLYALPADYLYAVGVAFERVERLVLDEEVKLRGKTYAAQHAQGVVRERHVRVERRAYDTVFKVGQAVEGVYQFAETGLVEAYRHGVYGEVAAVLVVLQRAVLHYRLARVVAVALLPGAYKLHFHVLILHLGGAEITEYGQPCPLAELLFKRLGNANAAAYNDNVDVV